MVRSPHPHARIVSIDKRRALAMPGVLGVFTGADCAADGLGPIGHDPLPKTRDDMKLTAPGGGEVFIGPHLLLPADKARHVGEAVAMVVAETKRAGARRRRGARGRLRGTAVRAALRRRACGPARRRSGTKCRTIFWSIRVSATPRRPSAPSRRPTHVVAMDFNIGRVTGVPIEPRACVANYDAASGRYTLHAGSGGAVRQKRELATRARHRARDFARPVVRRRRQFRHPQPRLSGIRPGAVGLAQARPPGQISPPPARNASSATIRAAIWSPRSSSRSTPRADSWRCARPISAMPARAACRCRRCRKGAGLITGNYDIPAARCARVGVHQHHADPGLSQLRAPGGDLRHRAADRHGRDQARHRPHRLRRRNLVRPKAMPYRNAVGMTYDSGSYEDNMDLAMRIADWDGFNARRREAKKRGKLLGLGPRQLRRSPRSARPRSGAEITVKPDGRVDVVIGTQPAGQGHETSFAQVVSDLLRCRSRASASSWATPIWCSAGGGTHSGRSMRHAAHRVLAWPRPS